MPTTKSTASWYVLAGAILWGTTGTAQAFAPDGATPAAIGAMRLAIGGCALLILAIARGSLRSGIEWPKLVTFLSAASMAAYQPFFFAGVSMTGVAVGTVVAIGSAPVLAGLLGLIVRKERPEKRWYLATLLAISGCALLFSAGGNVRLAPLGIFFSLCAGLAYASYAVTSKELLDRHPVDTVVAVVFSLSALMLAPLLFTQNLTWLLVPRGWLVVVHLGMVTTALAYHLFSRGLSVIPVATAVTLTLAEPLTAAFLGVLILGERLAFAALLGVAFLLVGLAVARS